MLDTSALPELMPVLQRRNVELALGGVFNSGILATRVDTERVLRFNYEPAQQSWVDRALKIQAVCDQHGVAIEAAALQFGMCHPATNLVLLGARSAQEWLHARAAARAPIPADFWAQLRHQHLLPEEAHTP